MIHALKPSQPADDDHAYQCEYSYTSAIHYEPIVLIAVCNFCVDDILYKQLYV